MRQVATLGIKDRSFLCRGGGGEKEEGGGGVKPCFAFTIHKS